MVAKTSVIKELEAIFDQGGNQLHILYGREDSEKEQLVKAFLQNKCCLYYRARQASAEAQLQFFGAELQQKCDTYVNKYTYDEYFRRIKSTGGDKFPHLPAWDLQSGWLLPHRFRCNSPRCRSAPD